MADWTTDSNTALTLSLVRAQADKQALGQSETYESFHPTFTYPLYGEEEKIYGYKDLVIDLRFASGSLAQYLSVRYSKKLTSSTVDDVEATIQKFIPPDYYTDEKSFNARVEDDAVSFVPMGELIHSYTHLSPSMSNGKGKNVSQEPLDPESGEVIVYETYHATWDTPGFREYHRNMQLFILLYIEAGSYIKEDEEQWEFVILFEKRKRPSGAAGYHFVGYSSLFNFYCYPDKVRMRLSQFVILSPYQRQGHGSQLYNAIYNLVLSRPDIAELSVEDPAEAFEDLRDVNDLKMLLSHARFMEEAFGTEVASPAGGKVLKPRTRARPAPMGAPVLQSKNQIKGKGKLGPPADKAWVEKWRRDLKIAGRQFSRLVEMLILLHLDPADLRAARAFRIQVKERLYRFNFETLAQTDKAERLEKLEETFQNVREDYLRILAGVR